MFARAVRRVSMTSSWRNIVFLQSKFRWIYIGTIYTCIHIKYIHVCVCLDLFCDYFVSENNKNIDIHIRLMKLVSNDKINNPMVDIFRRWLKSFFFFFKRNNRTKCSSRVQSVFEKWRRRMSSAKFAMSSYRLNSAKIQNSRVSLLSEDEVATGFPLFLSNNVKSSVFVRTRILITENVYNISTASNG